MADKAIQRPLSVAHSFCDRYPSGRIQKCQLTGSQNDGMNQDDGFSLSRKERRRELKQVPIANQKTGANAENMSSARFEVQEGVSRKEFTS